MTQEIITQDEYRKQAFQLAVQKAMIEYGVSISFKHVTKSYGGTESMTQVVTIVEYVCDPNWTPPKIPDGVHVEAPISEDELIALAEKGAAHKNGNGKRRVKSRM